MPLERDAVVEEALDRLVQQFSERSAFVRELIQNSLDAGAGRVEVVVEAKDERLVITVTDDGEGMDAEVIDKYLLTLFKSSKENDRTKIGKFGIGFVSIFAVEPEKVVVDTAKDGVHHRIVFAADRSYTLYEVADPFEGTAVALEVPLTGKKAEALAQEVKVAAEHWCRYARAEIVSTGILPHGGWEPYRIEAPFTLDLPVTFTEERPGFRVVLGATFDKTPFAGFYSKGLTLKETAESFVEGVSFRVESDGLGHTLTRDDVRRDAGFEDVLDALRALAKGPLRLQMEKALDGAAALPDAERRRLLPYVLHPTATKGKQAKLFRTVHGDLVALEALDTGTFLSRKAILFARAESPLTKAAQRDGRIVLLGSPDPDAEIAGKALGAATEALESSHAFFEEVPSPAWWPDAAGLGLVKGIAPARWWGAHATGQFLAPFLGSFGLVRVAKATPSPHRFLVNVAHPWYARIEALPEKLRPSLLRHVVARTLAIDTPLPPELMGGADGS